MKKRLGREYFEELYERSSDPWDFETSEYERKKYRRTLEALGERRFRRALEAGCSIGVFTEMLAPKCGELLAVDASERAASAARERLEKHPNVRVERRTLPEETPEGTFDLVIASEVLYYLDRATMLETLRRLENALEPGGIFVAVHWRKETKTYPLLGDEVHGLIRANTSLENSKSETEPEYVLDVFERPPEAGNRGNRGDDTRATEKPGRVPRESAGRKSEGIEEKRVESLSALDSRSGRKRAVPDPRRASLGRKGEGIEGENVESPSTPEASGAEGGEVVYGASASRIERSDAASRLSGVEPTTAKPHMGRA